jgi:hypothetical protein
MVSSDGAELRVNGMADYSSTFRKAGAYFFSQEAIVDLWNIGQTFLGEPPDLEVKLDGDHNISSTDPAQLFSDFYVKNKYIQEIEINGCNVRTKPNRQLSVKLSTEGWKSGVMVYIAGKKDECIKARTDIESIIDGRRNNFPNVTAKPLVSMSFLLVFFSTIFLYLHAMLTPGLNAQNHLLLIAVVLAEALAISLFIEVTLFKMYPRMTFEIGKSANCNNLLNNGEKGSTSRWASVFLRR